MRSSNALINRSATLRNGGSGTSALRPSSPSVTNGAVSRQPLVAARRQIPMAANRQSTDEWLHPDCGEVARGPELRHVRCRSEADPRSDSASTLIFGDDGGLLVDCLITTTEAAALATWVRSHECDLDYIDITHPHADHMLGLPAVLEAHPNAKPVALAESISAMEEQVSQGWMRIWDAFFPGQLPETPVVPAPLPGMSISVGDEVATVIPVGTTDSALSTVVRPSRVRRCGLQPNPRVAERGPRRSREPAGNARSIRSLDSAPTRSSPGIGILKPSTMTRSARPRRVANTSPTSKLRWLAAPPLAI
jgi:Metallo-beta-lactamase superfamily